MTLSADFNFIGTASKNEGCKSIHVKIHLNSPLDLSKAPMQSRQIPSKGHCSIGKCLLSYLTAYQTAIHLSVDLFSHSSEPKPSLHHVDCS